MKHDRAGRRPQGGQECNGLRAPTSRAKSWRHSFLTGFALDATRHRRAYIWLSAGHGERTSVGRRDEQGRRELPGVRRDGPGPRRPLARPDQGGRRAHQRRARPARRRLAERIAAAGDAIAEGEHDDQFPIDVFQTGSGTSSNMNANEVIAAARGRGRSPERPREHGAVVERRVPVGGAPGGARRGHRSASAGAVALSDAFSAKAAAFSDIVKAGRTHLMDAVPVTLGQEFAGYAAQMRLGRERVESALPRVAQIPLGGTATGTGLNTHPEFADARPRCCPRRPGSTSRRRPIRSRRRATATRSSSCPAR